MAKEIISIAIGPAILVFSIARKAFAANLKSRYKGYLIGRPPGPGRGLSVECSFSRKKLSSNERVSVVRTKDTGWRARRYDMDCTWNDRKGRAVLWPSLYSFDALLRVLCATQMTKHRGILLHSSGIVFRNRAFIFAGPSGSGKTTIARLSTSKRILSDEIVALTIDDKNKVKASGTPFWGEMGTGPASIRTYPVHSLYFLKKSDHLVKTTIKKEVALQKLLRCVCFFNHSAEENGRALDLCLDLIGSIATYVLCCEKKPLQWEYLLEKSG
jgi:hypothetical protein